MVSRPLRLNKKILIGLPALARQKDNEVTWGSAFEISQEVCWIDVQMQSGTSTRGCFMLSRHNRLDDGSFLYIKSEFYEKEIDKYVNRSFNVFIDDGYATHSMKQRGGIE